MAVMSRKSLPHTLKMVTVLPLSDLRLVGAGKHSWRFDEVPPRAGEHHTSPIVQGPAGLGKPGGVVAQGAACDQSHGEDNMSIPWHKCQTPESQF